jgi:hypothetical protein
VNLEGVVILLLLNLAWDQDAFYERFFYLASECSRLSSCQTEETIPSSESLVAMIVKVKCAPHGKLLNIYKEFVQNLLFSIYLDLAPEASCRGHLDALQLLLHLIPSSAA